MTPLQSSADAARICALAPIVPVLVVDDAATAADLAAALIKGGLPALEVTLRTDAALDAIREMAQVDGGAVGAGTLLTPDDVHAAVDAGATFGVSPGATDKVLDAAIEAGLAMLPGAATASEVMVLLEKGYSIQKFFPAEANGGAAALKAIGAPIPQVQFCPTGGITMANAEAYLSMPNVICAGGSWVAPQQLVAAQDWNAVTALATEAAGLSR
jgi:2-dehydro-3-deoxyphosphogluconate aldolase/(4S)-4-hydroxy-2-oxoglutarate aldolase